MKSEENRSTSRAESVVSELMPKDIECQAAHWLAILDGDDPSAENIAAFHQWKNEDEAHRKAFEDVLELWGSANILTRLEPPVSAAESATQSRFVFFSSTPSFANFGATAFALLLLVTLSIVQPWNNLGDQIYTTQVGEQKTLQLPDGSEVIINTDSQVMVSYQSDRRLLILQKGEAHFEVAHDPDRPFDVYAGNGLVKAIGTAFTVRMDQQAVSVYVTEGVVEVFNELEVAPPSPEPDNPSNEIIIAQAPTATLESGGVKVPAGQQAIYGEQAKKPVAVEASDNIDEKLSWRQGKLVFKGEPLGGVIEEFSRYTSTRIIIPGKKMRTMKVGGIFKIGDTVAMLDALKDGFGIHAQYVSDDIIYLVFEEDK